MYKASEGREDSREGNRYQMTNFTKNNCFRMHCNNCIRTASQIHQQVIFQLRIQPLHSNVCFCHVDCLLQGAAAIKIENDGSYLQVDEVFLMLCMYCVL